MCRPKEDADYLIRRFQKQLIHQLEGGVDTFLALQRSRDLHPFDLSFMITALAKVLPESRDNTYVQDVIRFRPLSYNKFEELIIDVLEGYNPDHYDARHRPMVSSATEWHGRLARWADISDPCVS